MEHLSYFFGFLSLRFSWPWMHQVKVYKTSLNSTDEIATTKCKKRMSCQREKNSKRTFISKPYVFFVLGSFWAN
jgi:hypothetical protein